MQSTALLNYINGELSKEAAKTFKDKVCNECEIHFTTFYRWMNFPKQIRRPDRIMIAAIAGKPESELFPA